MELNDFMSEEKLKELKEKAELWDSLGKSLLEMYGYTLPQSIVFDSKPIAEFKKAVVTIPNTSNASSHVKLLEEEIKEMVGGKCDCGSVDCFSHICPYKSEIKKDFSKCSCCDYCRNECRRNI